MTGTAEVPGVPSLGARKLDLGVEGGGGEMD